MRKILILSLIIIIGLGFSSCNNDDQQNDPQPTPKLEGNWKQYGYVQTDFDANHKKIQTFTLTYFEPKVISFTSPAKYDEHKWYGQDHFVGNGSFNAEYNHPALLYNTLARRHNNFGLLYRKLIIYFPGNDVALKTGTYNVDSLTTKRLVLSTIVDNNMGGKSFIEYKAVR